MKIKREDLGKIKNIQDVVRAKRMGRMLAKVKLSLARGILKGTHLEMCGCVCVRQ